MKKALLIGGAVVLVLAAAGIGFLLFGNNSEDSGSSNQNEQQAETNQNDNLFSAVPTDDLEFEATLSGETGDTSYEAVILSDGEGNSKYSGQSNGEQFEMYSLNDGSSIVCNGGTCFKVNGSEAQTPVSADQYEYTGDDLTNFRDMVEYQGEASCPAGTCSVWRYDENRAVVEIYLADDGKISKLTTTSQDGDKFEIEYEYKEVSVTPPANVRSIPQ